MNRMSRRAAAATAVATFALALFAGPAEADTIRVSTPTAVTTASSVTAAAPSAPNNYVFYAWFPTAEFCVARGHQGIRAGEWARFGCPTDNGGWALWTEK
ncbi:hypothetical protein [Streptomyces sp. SID3343]|uniref:hypothetical protein n=1 Tax=Streptomyces sp. SID3343 TaxID=2690260 RepID=UPI001368C0B0|nr:hypothetical protein [Streptomyces sp. SID3343]MYW03400.1 hypothetical protein [Streptomyces sp. SID3343]